jgi:WhiB family redox-sensing transcriptional regulator
MPATQQIHQNYAPDHEIGSNWRDNGLCTNPRAGDTWFPVGQGNDAKSDAEYAKAVCEMCPSRQPCFDWSIEQREPDGIWGGVDEEERRKILRRMGRGQGRSYASK